MSRTISTRALGVGAATVLLVGAVGLLPVASQETAASEPVSIVGDGHDISGTFVMPAGDGDAVPAVLMLHGYASLGDEVGNMYARLADALAAQGIASLRIDFAGMGASDASTLDYTYGSMTSDATAALDWLTAQPDVDPERVGVQGFSLGSQIGAHLVGTDERPVAFGSWSGAFYDGSEGSEESLAACEATGEGHIELDLGWRTIDHACDYWAEAGASTALTDFAPYDGALLLIAGSEDTTVPPAVSEAAATASASDDVTLEVVEGADHIFLVLTEDQTLADQVITTTADWFAQKL